LTETGKSKNIFWQRAVVNTKRKILDSKLKNAFEGMIWIYGEFI
jgi:hypothetical protein